MTLANKLFTSRFYYPRLKFICWFGRPVLIWNMGKVASTSIARSLWKSIGRHNVLTTHFINQPGYLRSELLYEALFIKCDDIPLPVITLTREPIGKNISSFFQNFEYNVGTKPHVYKNRVRELCDIFINKFDRHTTTINWYDDNILKYLNIDVYAHEFSVDSGYSIIEQDRFKILLLRSEEPDNIKERAVKELLKLDSFSIKNENIGNEKPYSSLYAKFKDQLQLPTEYLELMLESKYTRHFYSEQEISKIYKQWQKTA